MAWAYLLDSKEAEASGALFSMASACLPKPTCCSDAIVG